MSEPEKIVLEGDAEDVKQASARRTRRSFVTGAVAAAAGYGVWRLVQAGPDLGRQPLPLRRVFQTDASVARGVFNERGMAPEFSLSQARDLRLNGVVGLDQTLKLSSWRLQLIGSANPKQSPLYASDVTAWSYEYEGDMEQDQQSVDVKSAPGNGGVSKTGTPAPQQDGGSHDLPADTPKVNGIPHISLEERFNQLAQSVTHKRHQGDAEAGPSASSPDIGTPGLLLSMADLMKLPRVEHVFEFHCIEGWSEIVQWAGVRLSDFIEMYPPAKVNGREPRYVYMETPDGNYYGGYDMSAARHPQSLLVTEMGGKPLTQEHGAPLRLFMPIKYGYKNLKRVGMIAYTDTRPDDYWTKLGYDWYAGL